MTVMSGDAFFKCLRPLGFMSRSCQFSSYATHSAEVVGILCIQYVLGIHLCDEDAVPLFHVSIVLFLPFFP
jgi:hypothetical protein